MVFTSDTEERAGCRYGTRNAMPRIQQPRPAIAHRMRPLTPRT
jgi:hypothetical protein